MEFRNLKVSVRTHMKKMMFLMALFFMLQNKEIICLAENSTQEKVGELYALSAVLMDGETGRVLLEKEGEVMRPMASTTKIMTCILALEMASEDEIVVVSQNAAAQPKVHIGMRENEQYFLEDLLYSLMLESHNDSAVAIAEHLAGSVEAFAELMNEKAQAIGCQSTHFITPNGLDETDEGGAHSITASDLARIMSYCSWKSPKASRFLEITQTKNYQFQEITGKRSVSCVNHNAFLDMMEGAISGKTGFTGEAGYCYVGAVERGGKKLVVALLGCGWPNNKSYKWKDARKLINYGMENYHKENIWSALSDARQIVKDGIPKGQNLYETATIGAEVKDDKERLEFLMSQDETVNRNVIWKKNLVAPLKNGEVIGKMEYYIGEEKVETFEIVTTEAMERKNFKWILCQLGGFYLRLKKIN